MADIVLTAVGVVRSGCIWCCEPVPEFDPGAPRHHRLSLLVPPHLRGARIGKHVPQILR